MAIGSSAGCGVKSRMRRVAVPGDREIVSGYRFMDEKLGAGRAKPSAETLLTHGGRDPDHQFGFVNTPVFRGSTVLFKTLADHDAPNQPYLYGRAGNPTTNGVEELVTEL